MGPQIAPITTFSDQIKAFALIHSDSSGTRLGSSNPGPLVECSGSHFMMFHAWHSESLNVVRGTSNTVILLCKVHTIQKYCHPSFEAGISIAIPSNILTTLLHYRLSKRGSGISKIGCVFTFFCNTFFIFSPHRIKQHGRRLEGSGASWDI